MGGFFFVRICAQKGAFPRHRSKKGRCWLRGYDQATGLSLNAVLALPAVSSRGRTRYCPNKGENLPGNNQGTDQKHMRNKITLLATALCLSAAVGGTVWAQSGTTTMSGVY